MVEVYSFIILAMAIWLVYREWKLIAEFSRERDEMDKEALRKYMLDSRIDRVLQAKENDKTNNEIKELDNE